MACAGLLFRQHRRTRQPLLWWSTWCFVCLGLTNILLFIDLVVIVGRDLSLIRTLISLTGSMLLLYGLIRETT
jgi:hypothetical protein